MNDIKKQSWDKFIDELSFISAVIQFSKENPKEWDKIITECFTEDVNK